MQGSAPTDTKSEVKKALVVEKVLKRKLNAQAHPFTPNSLGNDGHGDTPDRNPLKTEYSGGGKCVYVYKCSADEEICWCDGCEKIVEILETPPVVKSENGQSNRNVLSAKVNGNIDESVMVPLNDVDSSFSSSCVISSDSVGVSNKEIVSDMPEKKVKSDKHLVFANKVKQQDDTQSIGTQDSPNYNFRIALLNSLGTSKGRQSEIIKWVEKVDVDILGICETWQYNRARSMKIDRYNFWTSHRPEGKKGGVGIWIKDNPAYKVRRLPTLSTNPELDSEQVWVTLKFNNHKDIWAFGVVYVKPWGNQSDTALQHREQLFMNIHEKLLHCKQKGIKVILMGDMNAKIWLPKNIDRPPYEPKIEADTTQFNHFVEIAGLEVANADPCSQGRYTRCPENRKDDQMASVLDYITYYKSEATLISCKSDDMRESEINSDHVPVLAEFDTHLLRNGETIRKEEKPPTRRYNISPETEFESFQEALDEAIIQKQDELLKNPEDRYRTILSIIAQAAEETIGVKEPRPPREKPPDTPVVRILRRTLRRDRYLRNIGISRGINQHQLGIRHKNVWKSRQNLLIQLRKEESRRVEQVTDKISKRGSEGMYQLYRYVKSKQKSQSEKLILQDKDGELLFDDPEIKLALRQQMDVIFNKQVWPDAHFKPPPKSLHLTQRDVRKILRRITIQEVQQAAKLLNNGSSAGTTQIPHELLKNLSEDMYEVLAEWMNILWDNSYMPEENNYSAIIFLHKKGATGILGNYRTLALGCNICKLYLKILTTRIQEASESSNLLGEIQNGFRKGRRGADNLFIMETIIQKMKRDKIAGSIALLDITKAYDRVCRPSLWYKLKAYGFPDKLVRMLEAVYQAPKGVVTFQDTTTEPIPIDLGLRQGCVLSPILFALYIADLGRILEESNLGIKINEKVLPGLFFADDMVLWGEDENLQKTLDIIGEFAATWKIEFAGEKSAIIPFNRTTKPNKKWNLGRKPPNKAGEQVPIHVSEVDDGRYLGIMFRRVHNIYKEQHDKALKKARWCSVYMRNLLSGVANPITMVNKLWAIYATPTFTYGLEAIAYPKSYIQQLETVQNQFLKLTLQLPPYTANEGVLATFGLQPLETIILKLRLLYHQYLSTLHERRWARMALLQQVQWVREDGLVDENDRPVPENLTSRGMSYWAKEITRQIYESGIDVDQLTTPLHIKFYLKQCRREEQSNRIATLSTLRFMDQNPGNEIDRIYSHQTQKWWLKARLEAFFLNHRYHGYDAQRREKCPVCETERETLIHFLWGCPGEIQVDGQQGGLPDAGIQDEEEKARYWLSIERGERERKMMSEYVHKRWARRVKAIQSRKHN